MAPTQHGKNSLLQRFGMWASLPIAMDLTKISASDFVRIQSLLQKKGKLQDEIRSIDAELSAIQTGEKPAAKRGRKPGRPAKAAPKAEKPKSKGKRGKRGAVKDSIIQLLKAAGPGGLTAREVATELGAKPINISTWFSSTGRQFPQIQSGPNGKRIWVEGAAPEAAAGAAPAEAAQAS